MATIKGNTIILSVDEAAKLAAAAVLLDIDNDNYIDHDHISGKWKEATLSDVKIERAGDDIILSVDEGPAEAGAKYIIDEDGDFQHQP